MADPQPRQPGFGDAVRLIRRQKGLTQEALADRADVHATWVSELEMGRLNPTLASVKSVASGLGVRLVELAALTEEMDARRAGEPT